MLCSDMSKQHGPSRDFDAMTNRRLEAAALFRDGIQLAEVARRLKVSRQSVSRWHASWREGGKKSLSGAGRAGRKPKLVASQLKDIEKALLLGPEENRISGQLWTLARVATVIKRLTGVHYHQGHVWRVLKRMGWSAQRPSRQAVERDEEAVQTWVKEVWPAVKKTPEMSEPS